MPSAPVPTSPAQAAKTGRPQPSGPVVPELTIVYHCPWCGNLRLRRYPLDETLSDAPPAVCFGGTVHGQVRHSDNPTVMNIAYSHTSPPIGAPR